MRAKPGLGLALCLLLAPPAARAARPDPLDGVRRDMERQGYALAQKAVLKAQGSRLVAVLFRQKGGEGYGRLRVYEVRGGKAKLVHIEASGAARVELDGVHGGGDWPDLFGDGSRFLLYTVEYPGINQRSLTLLRYQGGRLRSVGPPVPFGELKDLDSDGRPEIVSRSLPLGTFFAVECEDSFRSTARTAFRTSVYEWDGLALVRASRKHPRFFNDHIARLESEVAASDPRQEGRAGAFLGAALSLYFDYEETGRKREGWARFSEIFRSRLKDAPPLPSVKRCLDKLRAEMRRRLDIPDDWPD